MKWFDATHYPLGLPHGSIRAIVVLILLIGTLASVLATLEATISTGSLPAGPAALIALAGPILTQYAADRRGTLPQPPPAPDMAPDA